MESRPSGRQHASGGDGDQSPTQCAGMRSSGRSDQPYVLRGNPLLLCVRCYSGCASGSGRQLQLSEGTLLIHPSSRPECLLSA
ncbi:putative uncharacterized protein C2orf48 isoform X1 [Pongo pygmaeus]|uniref:putative uncharacterized protein C2orf48 isoform X1 n=1 Tax=Pongo pygmaeus TaxID=9600 RepID=UPI00300D9DB0